MKALKFMGSSQSDLAGFPLEAKRMAGFELWQVQLGLISAEDARVSHNRNLVTRALGVNLTISVDVRQERVLPGDIFLLCSDGLNDMVDDADIELAMVAIKENIPLLVQQLVLMANDNGGHDNISVAAIKIEKAFPLRTGFFARWFGAAS